MEHLGSNKQTAEGLSVDDNECHQIAQTLMEMRENLEEGGPEVLIEEIIAYVHQFLSPVLDEQVGKNIVRYRTWNEAYRQATRDRVKIEKEIKKASSEDKRSI